MGNACTEQEYDLQLNPSIVNNNPYLTLTLPLIHNEWAVLNVSEIDAYLRWNTYI